MEAIMNFIEQTGLALFFDSPENILMVAIACLLLFLAIVKKLNHCCCCQLPWYVAYQFAGCGDVS